MDAVTAGNDVNVMHCSCGEYVKSYAATILITSGHGEEAIYVILESAGKCVDGDFEIAYN